MTPSREAIEAVRREAMPNADDMTIIRHLQQRAALSRIAEQQRAARRVMPTEPSKWGELA